ncbi:hypothetical protein VIGAN_08338100 [Vigna angularis var. angularis]|uniref:Uncharacterized protein n=1 Tax=Vigna angularis var. angularis TaxID=157739 RepID=A0A0S3SUD0_PHAAN|nr:hypothetical protein VIGAN_08338100 [Vigna angularis var. angularis]
MARCSNKTLSNNQTCIPYFPCVLTSYYVSPYSFNTHKRKQIIFYLTLDSPNSTYNLFKKILYWIQLKSYFFYV